ncbi:hypothetical protein SVIO_054720 [Streptomyces violaceusniger]|uniref:Uncharacterized protein n=1 Tax=Streptomyces violaceusniger TaxID=68280 RepID=A0A4D4LA37_STRVO|nr:hypothetical protein SVIO_054720 [Streptomyces violaceusniger]
MIEIDAASHGGVDDARELREKAFFGPASSRYKIYIIDEAHMVTSAGFNALLKVVEEPPEHLKFIFATTEPEKVIGTIRSRTHHYPFRLVPPGTLRDYLGEVCGREAIPVEDGVLPLVVRAGAGSVRDSMSVMDQLLAGAADDGVTYAMATSLLGYTDGSLLDSIVDAFAASDGAAAFEVVNRVIEGGNDPRRFVADLLERLRDLVILAAVPDAAEKGLIDAPADVVERMQAQASVFGGAELSRAADLVNEGLTEMRGATSPRLQLELICARVLLPAAFDDERSVQSRLERLERGAVAGGLGGGAGAGGGIGGGGIGGGGVGGGGIGGGGVGGGGVAGPGPAMGYVPGPDAHAPVGPPAGGPSGPAAARAAMAGGGPGQGQAPGGPGSSDGGEAPGGWPAGARPAADSGPGGAVDSGQQGGAPAATAPPEGGGGQRPGAWPSGAQAPPPRAADHGPEPGPRQLPPAPGLPVLPVARPVRAVPPVVAVVRAPGRPLGSPAAGPRPPRRGRVAAPPRRRPRRPPRRLPRAPRPRLLPRPRTRAFHTRAGRTEHGAGRRPGAADVAGHPGGGQEPPPLHLDPAEPERHGVRLRRHHPPARLLQRGCARQLRGRRQRGRPAAGAPGRHRGAVADRGDRRPLGRRRTAGRRPRWPGRFRWCRWSWWPGRPGRSRRLRRRQWRLRRRRIRCRWRRCHRRWRLRRRERSRQRRRLRRRWPVRPAPPVRTPPRSRLPAPGRALRVLRGVRLRGRGSAPEAAAYREPEPSRVSIEDDMPAEDDPDLDDTALSGHDLIVRELGATVIEEIVNE